MHKRKIIIFFILFININTFGQQWSEYLENDWNKTKSALNSKTLLITGSWFAGMYLLSFGDEYLNENVKGLNKGYLKHYFKTVDNLGNGPFAAPLSIGIAAISLIGNDTKFRRTALTSVESMAVTALIVYSLKIGIGRKVFIYSCNCQRKAISNNDLLSQYIQFAKILFCCTFR